VSDTDVTFCVFSISLGNCLRKLGQTDPYRPTSCSVYGGLHISHFLSTVYLLNIRSTVTTNHLSYEPLLGRTLRHLCCIFLRSVICQSVVCRLSNLGTLLKPLDVFRCHMTTLVGSNNTMC